MQNLENSQLDIVTGGVTEGPNGEGCTDPRIGGKDKLVMLPTSPLPVQITLF